MPSQPPDPYVRQFDFTNHEQTQPTKPLPGSKVDLELNEARESINATISRLNELQADDGTLRSSAVPGDINQKVAAAEAARNDAVAAKVESVAAKDAAVAAAGSVAGIADNALAQAQQAADDANTYRQEASFSAGSANLASSSAGISASTASTHANTATTQAGLALTRANDAAASANSAAASASAATTQAGLALTRANAADASADAAAQSAIEAEASAQAAEAAASSINPSAYIPQPAVAPVDGQILAFDGTSWVALDNYAQVLQESVRNETGATLAKGTVVYISGASGNKPLVAKAQANSEAGSSKTFAVLAAAVANNNNGNAVTSGLLKGLDLSAYSAGAALWLSPTVAGGFTSTKPSAPNHAVFVGWVVRSHATQGELLVKIQNGYELGELHDVSLPSPLDGEVLKFDAGDGLWKSAPANPFDQNLNIGYPVSFGSVTITDASTNLTLNGGIVFSDATTQTTAGLSPADAAATYYPLTNPAGYISDVPAASTTVAGKVELATATEAIAATSTTLAVTPDDLYWNRVTPGMGLLGGSASSGLTAGTGAASNASMFGITCFGPDAGVVGYGGRRFQMNNGQVGSLERDWGVVDFDRRISLSFRIAYHLVTSGSPNNDSVINVNYGDLLGTDTGGTLARKGFGIQIYGHNNPLRLTVHDGTTYRTVNSSFTPTSSTTVTTMDFLLVSEAGTVTLYQRTTRTGGWTQIATSANGPTGLSASNACSVTCTSRNESINVTSVRWRCLAGFFTVEY